MRDVLAEDEPIPMGVAVAAAVVEMWLSSEVGFKTGTASPARYIPAIGRLVWLVQQTRRLYAGAVRVVS